MHDLAFADATRPTRCVILRLPLLGFSIGHELLLLQQGNPLVSLSAEEFDKLPDDRQRAAIIRAVMICANTWTQNQKRQKWLRLWGWTLRKSDFPLAIAEWRNYRFEGSSFPPVTGDEADMIANGDSDGPKGREIGGPFLARLYCFAASLPEREIQIHGDTAFDFPLGLATFLYFSHLEMEGKLKIENTKEREIRLEMASHREAVAREQEEKCQA